MYEVQVRNGGRWLMGYHYSVSENEARSIASMVRSNFARESRVVDSTGKVVIRFKPK